MIIPILFLGGGSLGYHYKRRNKHLGAKKSCQTPRFKAVNIECAPVPFFQWAFNFVTASAYTVYHSMWAILNTDVGIINMREWEHYSYMSNLPIWWFGRNKCHTLKDLEIDKILTVIRSNIDGPINQSLNKWILLWTNVSTTIQLQLTIDPIVKLLFCFNKTKLLSLSFKVCQQFILASV